MGVNRREFLKIAGISTLMGLGGKAAFDILRPGELEASTDAIPLTKGERWAMVIDANKVDQKIIDSFILTYSYLFH